MQELATKVVFNQPGVKAQGAVIWLHGLGADYNDFVPIVQELDLDLSLKFVFPNAPLIPVTINGGMRMRAWYDILDFSALHREVDSQGIIASIDQVNALIEELLKEGFQEGEIVLAGFSQGGVICYYAGLNSAYNLAGIMILSSYLPDQQLIDVTKVQQKRDLAILVCHGTQDPVVSVNYAQQALKCLEELELTYQWYEYPMQHAVCAAEVRQLSNWLAQILKK